MSVKNDLPKATWLPVGIGADVEDSGVALVTTCLLGVLQDFSRFKGFIFHLLLAVFWILVSLVPFFSQQTNGYESHDIGLHSLTVL